MKYYSDYNKKYIKDICDFLNRQGLVRDEMNRIFHQSVLKNYTDRGLISGEVSTLSPDCYDNFTDFLQGTVVKNAGIYQLLLENRLVNRGYCPYTGEVIGKYAASWEFFGREVYVSKKGFQIMNDEADKHYVDLFGEPPPTFSSPIVDRRRNGCLLSFFVLISAYLVWHFCF